jgi:hypothetical protein
LRQPPPQLVTEFGDLLQCAAEFPQDILRHRQCNFTFTGEHLIRASTPKR